MDKLKKVKLYGLKQYESLDPRVEEIIDWINEMEDWKEKTQEAVCDLIENSDDEEFIEESIRDRLTDVENKIKALEFVLAGSCLPKTEEKTTDLSLFEALKFISKGKKIKRSGWVLSLIDKDQLSHEIKNACGIAWEDVLANDWMVVD